MGEHATQVAEATQQAVGEAMEHMAQVSEAAAHTVKQDVEHIAEQPAPKEAAATVENVPSDIAKKVEPELQVTSRTVQANQGFFFRCCAAPPVDRVSSE